MAARLEQALTLPTSGIGSSPQTMATIEQALAGTVPLPPPPPSNAQSEAIRAIAAEMAGSTGVPAFLKLPESPAPSPFVQMIEQASREREQELESQWGPLLEGTSDPSTLAAAFQRNETAAQAIPSEPRSDTLAPGADPTWRDKLKDLGREAGLSRHDVEAILGGPSAPLGMGILDVIPVTGVATAAADAIEAGARGDQLNAAMAAMGAIPGGKVAKKASKALEEILKHPTWRRAPSKSAIAESSAALPNVRRMTQEEAIRAASPQPHLIPGGEGTEGAFIGGPRNVKTYGDLKKVRERVYDFIANETRGADWYDRYRAFLKEITGGAPLDTKTQAEIEALMSAGVDPSSEFGFALKQLNAAIAGHPETKAARPMQQETVNEAARLAREATTAEEMAAATKMARGKKTGEYANKIDSYPPMSPEQLTEQSMSPMIGHNQGPPMFEPIPERVPGTTGVNDFRYARQWEYTEPTGEPQKGAIGPTAHKFIDYETTLMVDAANRHNLGGRSNWTGEQLQAAPWVRQKAEDLMSRRPGLSYEDAINEATKTIADFGPKHTLSATHEVRPGVGLGYIPELDTAPDDDLIRYSLDPRRSWATAPGGRDAIYAGTGIPNVTGAKTGFNMRVRPTGEMQGIYEGPAGLETNPGQVARPLVGIETDPTTGRKRLPQSEREIATAAERLRGLVDVNRVEAAHIPFFGGKVSDSGAWSVPLTRKLTEQEAIDLKTMAKEYGFEDVVDRGDGVTITSFYAGPPVIKGKDMQKFLAAVKTVLPDAGTPIRSYTDSIYEDLADKFLQGEGSGEVSQHFIDALVTPELRDAFDANPELAQVMLNKIEADRGYNLGRQDVTTVREIIGSGRGWVGRLEAAIKAGAVPSFLGAGLYSQMLSGRTGEGEAQPSDESGA